MRLTVCVFVALHQGNLDSVRFCCSLRMKSHIIIISLMCDPCCAHSTVGLCRDSTHVETLGQSNYQYNYNTLMSGHVTVRQYGRRLPCEVSGIQLRLYFFSWPEVWWLTEFSESCTSERFILPSSLKPTWCFFAGYFFDLPACLFPVWTCLCRVPWFHFTHERYECMSLLLQPLDNV